MRWVDAVTEKVSSRVRLRYNVDRETARWSLTVMLQAVQVRERKDPKQVTTNRARLVYQAMFRGSQDQVEVAGKGAEWLRKSALVQVASGRVTGAPLLTDERKEYRRENSPVAVRNKSGLHPMQQPRRKEQVEKVRSDERDASHPMRRSGSDAAPPATWTQPSHLSVPLGRSRLFLRPSSCLLIRRRSFTYRCSSV
ncbi:hypothetical protein PHSY_004741 [Pseudozyma hubeiensis SY62]|uniref:Uncharacterized protein n=1 Tax=Pseudozyma hubeiensis (strain SY62) TaxID=1305764 RepID=R9P717_PSEHS|nr:hypothetical protein PHSY_004741 [Pseudozyma hubeiensis SY62]GAC97156.1 hypothetical protein PHSY_004741 [Pseudozyma hubeiensis SY62]